MSKILRRPMFRGGGKVSSYGNGITSPLVPGYAGGGSINTPRRGLVSLAGGYAGMGQPLYNNPQLFSIDDVLAQMGQPSTGAAIKEYAKNNNLALQPTVGDEFKINEKTVFYPDGDTKVEIGEGENIQEIDFKDTKKFTGENPEIATTYPGSGDTQGILPELLEKVTMTDKKNSLGNEIYTGNQGDLTSKIDTSLANGVLEKQNKVSDDSELTLEEIKDSLGGGKAFGRDATDMLLRFSGAEGDTVAEKFKNYAALESKAGPSRTETIDQAAATFMLKDKLQTKRDKAKVEMMRADVDYKISAGKKIDISEGILASTKGGQTTDKKLAIGIQSSTSPTTGNKYVFKGVINAKDLEQILESKQLKTGDTLIVKQTSKDETSGIDKVIKKIIEIQADGTGKEIYKLT